MKNKILKAIDDYNMLPANTYVVVGVSGGADSMALLYFLNSIKNDRKLNIIAVHINHCLRGDESLRDENFVRDYCQKQNIKCEVLVIDVKKIATQEKTGTEECARNIRYDFFSKIANKYNAKIATAHTLSDSFETILFNLARGTGINGLCGIPAVRNNIIRPLIYVTRKETENYCNENGILYVTDSTNLSKDYNRNKIRLDVIPVLKNINAAVENNANRMINELKNDISYLDLKTDKAIKNIKINDDYDLIKLKKLHPAIKSRAIRKIVKDVTNVSLEKVHVDLIVNIIEKNHGAVNVPCGYTVLVDKNRLKILKSNNILKETNKINDTKILTDYKEKSIIEVITINEFYLRLKKDKNLYNLAIDYKMVNNNTLLRKRRDGDKFKQAGKRFTKKLKKLFNENKIPLENRDKISIISNDDNILWLEGFGPSDESKVNENTEKVAIIQLGEC